MAARSISAFLDTQTTRYAEILSPVPTVVAREGLHWVPVQPPPQGVNVGGLI